MLARARLLGHDRGLPRSHREGLAILAARRRSLRTPHRPQFQTTECGIGALRAILAHHGLDLPPDEIRQATGISRACLNARDIVVAARRYGLQTRALRREPGDLRTVGLPAIVHLNFIHFVVLEEVTPTRMRLNDPAAGRIWLERGAFDEAFTGVVIEFTPGPGFRPAAAPPAWRMRACSWLRPGLPWIAGASVAAALWTASMAILAGVLDERVAVHAAWPGAGLLASALLARLGLLRAAKLAEASVATTLLRHVARQPDAFFAYRMADRLAATVESTQPIAATLYRQGLAGLLWSIQALALFAALTAEAPSLAASLAALLLLHLAVLLRLHFGRGRLWRLAEAEIAPVPISDALALAPQLRFAAGAEAFAAGADDVRARTWLAALPGRLRAAGVETAAAALLAAVVAAAIGIGSSPGSILLALTVAALWPPALAGLLRCTRLATPLAHVEDVLSAQPAPPQGAPAPPVPDAPLLELRDLRFGYAAKLPPVLDGASLLLRAGEQLGLAGPSGCGKSTLATLAAGLDSPWSGEVLLDGRPVAQLRAAERTAAIAWLGRMPLLFEGSLADNLTLWRGDVPPAAMLAALEDVGLAEEFAPRGGLAMRIETGGRNVSGGQAQRIEIARALLGAPRALILDEVLDALDPPLEARIRERLRRRGIALLVVSQREGTLRACDRVVWLAAQAAAQRRAVPAGVPEDPTDAISEADGTAVLPVIARCFGETVPAAGSLEERLAAIGLRARAVRFIDPSRWERDPGPMIGWLHDGTPVALVPQPGGYRLTDAAGRSRLIMPGDAARLLRPDTIAFRRSPRGLRDALLHAGAGDAALGAGCASLAALALVLCAMTASWAAVLAVPALWGAALVAQLRAEGARAEAVTAPLLARLSRLSVRFARGVTYPVAMEASAALDRILATLRTAPGILGGALAQLLLAIAGGLLHGLPSAVIPLCCAIPVLVLLVAVPERRLQQQADRARFAAAEFLDLGLDGWNRLRALGAEPRFIARWLAARRSAGRRDRRAMPLTAALDAWPVIAPPLGLLLLSGHAPLDPTGAVLAWLAFDAAARLGRLGAEMLWLPRSARALRRMLDGPTEGGNAPPDASRHDIALERVSFTYQGATRPSVVDVSLTLAPGRIVALAGASGSGKSTLLSLLLGLDTPDAGRVLAGGEDLRGIDLAAWRSGIGAVLQGARLDQAGTIRGQVSGPLRAPEAAVWEALRLAGVAEEVAAMPMGLQSIVEYSGLSGGEQQRVMIAAALLRRPWLLVLDEATTALPEAAQARLLAGLRARGIGCLLVTHRPGALALADEVHVMTAGRLTYSGPPSGLPAGLTADAAPCSGMRDEA